MLGLAKKSTVQKPDPQILERLHVTLMEMTRAPVFYERFGVPDTVDGRYDLMCLILSLMLFRLQQAQPEMAQGLFDLSFKYIELGLRETGVGDLGIPKHMKRMIEAFYGRAALYYEALEQQDTASLCAVLERNLYAAETGKPVGSMAEWVQIIRQYLSQVDINELYAEPETLMQLLPSSPKGNE